MRCPLCDGPVVNGRCTACGMPYKKDEILYHLNESRSDHYKHATPNARKIMAKQQKTTSGTGNSARTANQERQKQIRQEAMKRMTASQTAGTGRNTVNRKSSGKKKGGKFLGAVILITVLASVAPGIAEVAREAYYEYKYSQSGSSTQDTEEITTDDMVSGDYYYTWTDGGDTYYGIDAGFGTIEAGRDIEPGSYSLYAVGDYKLEMAFIRDGEKELYTIDGNEGFTDLDMEDGDQLEFEGDPDDNDTLYFVTRK